MKMKKTTEEIEKIEKLKAFFKSNFVGSKKYKQNICCAVNKINELSGNKLADKILELINLPASNNRYIDPVGDILIYAKELLYSSNCSTLDNDSKESYVNYFRQFSQLVLGFFYANTFLTMGKHDDFFCKLIANNALFASTDVVNKVRNGELGTDEFKKLVKTTGNFNNQYASWDYMEHYRDNKLKKNKIKYKFDPKYLFYKRMYPGIKPMMAVDDNTLANQYFKKAILESCKNGFITSSMWTKFKDYEVCHIWDKPGDRRYYASICNLVLIPRALAQLTDHNDAVKSLLRNKVHDLFDFIPEGETLPEKPHNYYKYQWRTI